MARDYLDIVGVIQGTWESEKAGCGCVFYTGVEYNTLNRQGRDTLSQRSVVWKIPDNPNSRTIFIHIRYLLSKQIKSLFLLTQIDRYSK